MTQEAMYSMLPATTYADKSSALRGAKRLCTRLGVEPVELLAIKREDGFVVQILLSEADVAFRSAIREAGFFERVDWKTAEAKSKDMSAQFARQRKERAQADKAALRADNAKAKAVKTEKAKPAPAKPDPVAAPKFRIGGQGSVKTTTRDRKTETNEDGIRAGSKAETLVAMLERPEGATHKEMCEAVGWGTCLPRAMEAASRANLTIRKEKEGRETRYFGSRG